MADTVHLNGAGRAHMNSLIDAGKVDSGPSWDISTDERNGLDGNMFLGSDTSYKPDEAGYRKYPFGKGGKVYRRALAAIESRAAANGETQIHDAAQAALARIDAKQKQMSDGGTTFTDRLSNREIFAAGKWNASTGPVSVDSAMLDRVVANYEALNSKVPGFSIPIKLGHNKKVGEPAYGYAENVRREGNTLLADFVNVPPEIVDAIGNRRYNSVSVELWPKVDHGGQTYRDVLGAVALLGSEWPAVKGLKPVFASEFAHEGAVMLSQEEDDDMPNFTQEQVDQLVEVSVEKAVKAAKDEFTAQLEVVTAERDTAMAALDAFREDDEKKQIAAIIEAAEKAGQITPANKDRVTAFAEALRTALPKGKGRSEMVAQFKDFVEALPKKVDFTEKGGTEQDRAGDDDVQATINRKVAEVRKDRSDLSYKDALDMVFEQNPELKTRYAEER